MEYRQLGAKGPQVSVLSLGCVKFSNSEDDEACHRIVDMAIDGGINCIDTAHVYGRSEEIIGAALATSAKRDRAFLATKIQPQRNDRATIITQCECSLQRLQTDRIDLLQLHRPSPDIPIEETLSALYELLRSGKVRYIGSSGFKAWQIMEALWCARELGLTPFVSEQSVYSLLCRRIEDELIPMAQSHGVGLLLWSPLGAGVLSDRYTRDNPPAHIELSDQAWQVIDCARTIAADKHCSTSQLAFAWCLAQPGITSAIAGPSSAEQLVDNLGAIDVQLTDDELAALNQVATPGWTEQESWVGREFSRAHHFSWW